MQFLSIGFIVYYQFAQKLKFCQYVFYLLSKSLSLSVKWSMRPFSKEQGENYMSVIYHKLQL